MIPDFLSNALASLGNKPADGAKQADKKRYSELLSASVALAFAKEFRDRGLVGTRPFTKGEAKATGGERRMAGGIGAKKADVTWSTDESGLLLGVSIKSINFRDVRSKNYQKNLTNRRGDLLFESVTLHRRFPYAVLAGFLFFDAGAASDGSATRRSTFENAHLRLRLFTGRDDPGGRDEQYERLYIVLHRTTATKGKRFKVFLAGDPTHPVDLSDLIADLLHPLLQLSIEAPGQYE